MKRTNKVVGLILAICLLLSMLSGFAPLATVSVGSRSSGADEAPALPAIVDPKEASENGYVERRKTEEPDLNTLVFANQDGTNTMRVYSHPVKYVAEDGTIRDISLGIKAKKDGGFVSADHEIVTFFEKDLTKGITLSYNDVGIRLVPSVPSGLAPAAALSEDGKAVSYRMNRTTSFVYELTYTGFKEDIVVEEYTGQTEYQFRLYTGGLTLWEDNGAYCLKDADGTVKATVGDIIVFSADERHNTMGSMTCETVRANQEYVLTIHLDAAYLADKATAYPIRIDPTIEINYDNNGSGAIEDVCISENTVYSGTSGSLYVGRHETAGLIRTLMRFPNLSLSGISSSQITAATVELRDLMCQSDENMTVDCHIYEKTAPGWSELGTTTWANTGSSYVGALLDSHLISYGQGNVSGSNQRYSFNILNAAKAWADGTQSPQRALVFKASSAFESQTGSDVKTWYKTFASYNRSSNRPSLSISYAIEASGGDSFTDAETLSLNQGCFVNIDSANNLKYFRFYPTTTGFYTFSSFSNSGDPIAHLYNCDEEILCSDNDSAGNSNFSVTYHLLENNTYFFGVSCSGTGSCFVQLTPTSSSSSVETTTIDWGDTKTLSMNMVQQASCYKFVPSTSGEYFLFTQKTAGDPQIWLYNSNLTLISTDADGAGNWDSRLVCNLVAGTTYYLVAGHSDWEIGTFELKLMKASDISTADYYLRNRASGHFLKVKEREGQEVVRQNLLVAGADEKWKIQKQSDGYYTIKSLYGNTGYLGISSTLANADNVSVFSSISDATKWKVYELDSYYLIFEPKTAPGKILCAKSFTADSKIELSLLGSSASERNVWNIYRAGSYYAEIENHFDKGYPVYYNETEAISQKKIFGYVEAVAQRYYDLFGLTLLFRDPEYYASAVDSCKGVVSSSNIDTLCTHSGTNHTALSSVILSFRGHFPGSSTLTHVLWTGHKITFTAASGAINYNRSCSSGTSVIMLERSSASVRERDSKGILMHELNHQFGAPDHYHELDSLGNCLHKEICSTCSDNPRDPSCIMNQSRIDVSGSNVICAACQADILTHLNGHHSTNTN